MSRLLQRLFDVLNGDLSGLNCTAVEQTLPLIAASSTLLYFATTRSASLLPLGDHVERERSDPGPGRRRPQLGRL
ncbi:hypothetical protein CHARACLAT_007680 [Characodon lateralis]|uniref:Uncharacterized protein n=1 Tax=Characodon lateralis TaxID=208331 RepID=A0ABU7DSW8_9TELE|nr:hypothetical protein [Characodon lateralis]